MKNSLFKTAALLVSVTVLGACNKDNSSGLNLNAVNSSPANDPIEQLRIFKKQIESVKANPTKSNETIALSEALWDIENTFNLTYADAEQYFGQTNNHEFTLSIPTEGNDVLLYDAVSLYSDVVLQAREALASDLFEEKGVVSLTVKEAEADDGIVRVTFSSKTGERCTYNPSTVHVDGPFGLDDDWMFAAPMGKCNDPDIPSGADEQLQEQLYIELIEPFTDPEPGFRNIYVNRVRIVFDGSNYQGIYYTTDPENMCIGHDFMNDHYAAEKRIISQTIPEQYYLFGFSPVSIEVEGRILTEPTSALTHYTEVEYGIRLRVSTDEFGETQDLLSE